MGISQAAIQGSGFIEKKRKNGIPDFMKTVNFGWGTFKLGTSLRAFGGPYRLGVRLGGFERAQLGVHITGGPYVYFQLGVHKSGLEVHISELGGQYISTLGGPYMKTPKLRAFGVHIWGVHLGFRKGPIWGPYNWGSIYENAKIKSFWGSIYGGSI